MYFNLSLVFSFFFSFCFVLFCFVLLFFSFLYRASFPLAFVRGFARMQFQGQKATCLNWAGSVNFGWLYALGQMSYEQGTLKTDPQCRCFFLSFPTPLARTLSSLFFSFLLFSSLPRTSNRFPICELHSTLHPSHLFSFHPSHPIPHLNLLLTKLRHTGQRLSLEQLERGTTARRAMADSLFRLVVGHHRSCVTAADDDRASGLFSFQARVEHRLGTGREVGELEYAGGAIEGTQGGGGGKRKKESEIRAKTRFMQAGSLEGISRRRELTRSRE